MLKKFDNFINEDMSYTDFFGKNVTHDEALQKRVRSLITNIITDELGISEKSFKQYDNVIEDVKTVCDKNTEIYEKANEYYSNGKRLQYVAEIIYDEFFKK